MGSRQNWCKIMASSNSIRQICSSCKYQGRKCDPDCILAPYFPADRMDDFLKFHSLFGIERICPILTLMIEPIKRPDAVKSMLYEANARLNHPGGCMYIIHMLQEQLKMLEYKLHSLKQEPPHWRGVFLGQLGHGIDNLQRNYSANQELDHGLLEAQQLDHDSFEAQQLEQQQERVDLQVVHGGTGGVVEGGEVAEVGQHGGVVDTEMMDTQVFLNV
ncbi:hypothetical protein AMTR_s00002p00248800 [Amborella trichopoda]|uniref:LOB domain-containing protein n=1 Tax=Amborella trichopoda TaxID=13333 RepID=W1P0V5_AMBTC|nr:hypothetical protein AMTR_s00002p00248800 [Amborella trichopoda]